MTELRDQREALTLSAIMDAINRRELATAADILVSRLVALQFAKRKGGSWEKAAKLELIPEPGTEYGPAGLSGLS